MIDPPPASRMCRAASRVPAITARRLTAMTLSKSARSSSKMLRCMVPETPALLTMTCRPPNCSTAVDTSPLTWSSSDTSASTNSASAPMSSASAAPRVAVDVGDQHLGAFGGEPPRQAFAEPRRAAGDDRDLALEFVATASLPAQTDVCAKVRVNCAKTSISTRSSRHAPPRRKIQQQFVDGVGLFDLRAVARLLDDGRAAAGDLLGDLGRPACGQQFVAPTLDHQRRHGDALVGALARRQRRRLQPGPAKSAPPPRPPTRRARCSTRSAAARTRRRSGTPGRGTAPRRSAACRPAWRRSRTARPSARCAGSRRRRRSSPGCASAAPATPTWRRRTG